MGADTFGAEMGGSGSTPLRDSGEEPISEQRPEFYEMETIYAMGWITNLIRAKTALQNP